MAAATKTHFENEERIMAPLHLKNEDRHKAEHRRLLQYLGDIYEKMNNPQENWRHQLSDINDLLFRHIIVFDMECKNHHP
ncbi:MAG: hypothetical protein A3G18_12450 [Rhodospirillales bacterium RIFCSPLOWO2_12_FULL_58_28]|nr:MAG: hypothetical protein A3H92_12465 [Rhodospirillales bacterium RIFCSPLOWO2_02_FULL_58_16]OHC79671.1 MAG: hypothetical protein A3G18_12450 [Rhodospirillales bacterium RIFCSPLOWO2_12_FULL_58_28]